MESGPSWLWLPLQAIHCVCLFVCLCVPVCVSSQGRAKLILSFQSMDTLSQQGVGGFPCSLIFILCFWHQLANESHVSFTTFSSTKKRSFVL